MFVSSRFLFVQIGMITLPMAGFCASVFRVCKVSKIWISIISIHLSETQSATKTKKQCWKSHIPWNPAWLIPTQDNSESKILSSDTLNSTSGIFGMFITYNPPPFFFDLGVFFGVVVVSPHWRRLGIPSGFLHQETKRHPLHQGRRARSRFAWLRNHLGGFSRNVDGNQKSGEKIQQLRER